MAAEQSGALAASPNRHYHDMCVLHVSAGAKTHKSSVALVLQVFLHLVLHAAV